MAQNDYFLVGGHQLAANPPAVMQLTKEALVKDPRYLALGILFLAACSSLQSTENPLVGAWWIVETTTISPDSTWVNSSPQPGLYVFTESHFSLMLVQGGGPRANILPNGTDEERLAAFNSFIADAGTYVRTDSTIEANNLIAKVPDVMKYLLSYRYSLSEDSLRLRFTRGWAPTGGEITYVLTRLKD